MFYRSNSYNVRLGNLDGIYSLCIDAVPNCLLSINGAIICPISNNKFVEKINKYLFNCNLTVVATITTSIDVTNTTDTVLLLRGLGRYSLRTRTYDNLDRCQNVYLSLAINIVRFFTSILRTHTRTRGVKGIYRSNAASGQLTREDFYTWILLHN